jgi:hypothetical protein
MTLFHDPAVWFKELFLQAGLSYSFSSFLSTVALVLIVVFLSWLSNLIAKAIILKIVTRIVKKTTSTWDDVFHPAFTSCSGIGDLVHGRLGT